MRAQDAPVASRKPLLRVAAAMAVAAGVVLALALVYQHLDVYFTFGGDPVVPSDAEESRYLWTAGAGLAVMAAGLVLALLGSSKRLCWCSAAGVVVTLILAGVFPVPQDRWRPDPPTYDLPENYTPCYSGSQGCGARE